eukprot:PhM_4_TR8160/c0_g1_i1/m.12171/K02519/infB, MTIF2; translation initiation factor IF-2
MAFRTTVRVLQSLHGSVGGGQRPFMEGKLNASRYGPGGFLKTTAGKLTAQKKAQIQQDRREHGLPQVVDWESFMEEAIPLPSRAGPVYCGPDDPRVARYMRRQERMAKGPDQIPRPEMKKDPVKELENHPLRHYFTTAVTPSDPMTVADGLYHAGKIRQSDLKHMATKIKYVQRPPIVSIMGHVDHGKTTLLDTLRNARVAAGEAGGITQSIGAFTVKVPNPVDVIDQITFIDTPGHAAFEEMRKSGAAATDLIVLVVATTDGVQPQTLEVIDIAKERGIPLVIAANKIDRQPDTTALMNHLTSIGLELEPRGGDTLFVPISAKEGTNLDNLLEAIQLQAAMSEIHTPEPCRAEVSIIDSKNEYVSGVVRCGVLKRYSFVCCGISWTKLKKITNDRGEELVEAGPGTPVKLEGFTVLPKPGNVIMEVANMDHAKKFVNLMRDVYAIEGQRETFLQFLSEDAKGKHHYRKPVNQSRFYANKMFALSVKGGTFGQLQALLRLVYAIPEVDGTQLVIISTEVGSFTDSDLVQLSGRQTPSGVLLFGDVRDDSRMQVPDYVDVQRFDVVFHAIEWLKRKIVDLLPKKQRDVVHASATVRSVFPASQARGGNAGGVIIDTGRLHLASTSIRVQRNGETVYTGKIQELRRFKENVSYVEEGLECGVVLEGAFTFQVGDLVQDYTIEYDDLDVDEIYAEAAKKEEEDRREMIRNEEEAEAAEASMNNKNDDNEDGVDEVAVKA